MARSQAERSRANRLRAKLNRGESLKAHDAEWFAEYDNGSTSIPTFANNTPIEEATVIEETARPKPAPADNGLVALDFGDSVTSVAHAVDDATTCTIKDCPKCKATAGAKICGTTGEKVWPPVSAEGAEAMAASILGFIAMVARFLRKDKEFVMPTDADCKMLGGALRVSLNRRFNSAGAVDDLFAVAFAIGSFGHKAYTEKPTKAIGSGE